MAQTVTMTFDNAKNRVRIQKSTLEALGSSFVHCCQLCSVCQQGLPCHSPRCLLWPRHRMMLASFSWL